MSWKVERQISNSWILEGQALKWLGDLRISLRDRNNAWRIRPTFFSCYRGIDERRLDSWGVWHCGRMALLMAALWQEIGGRRDSWRSQTKSRLLAKWTEHSWITTSYCWASTADWREEGKFPKTGDWRGQEYPGEGEGQLPPPQKALRQSADDSVCEAKATESWVKGRLHKHWQQTRAFSETGKLNSKPDSWESLEATGSDGRLPHSSRVGSQHSSNPT